MPTTIKLKYGSGAPSASDLVQGEPALDLTNKRLYSEDGSGNVIEIGTNPSSAVTIGSGAAADTKIVYDGNAKDFYIGLDDSTDKFVVGVGSAVGTNSILTLDDDSVTVGDGTEVDTKIIYDGNAKDFYIGLDDSTDKFVVGVGSAVGTNSILTLDDDSVTVGDGAEVDTKIIFDGNAQDYYVGLDDSSDSLVVGLGSAVGTTPAFTINSSQQVTFAQTATFSNISTDGVTLKLDGSYPTGVENTALGVAALEDVESGGNYNVTIGAKSGTDLTTGVANTFVGAYSAYTATTPSYSVGIGYHVLYDLTSGSHNVAIGLQSQYDTNTGHSNTTLGNYSMYGNTTGYLNTACGYASMYSSAGHTGTYNAALGAQSLYAVTTGYNNTVIGGLSGYGLTEGHTNTLIGVNAGYALLTGDNNTCLGGNAGRAASPSGNITSGNNVICLGDNSITDIYCADTSISSSDERDKADITDFTHGLSWISKMRPVTYKWDKRSWYLGEDEDDITAVTRDGSKKKSKVNVGLIAQEVLAIEQADSFSSSKDNMLVVNLNEDETGYGIKYERIVPVLINAIKELEARIKVLEG